MVTRRLSQLGRDGKTASILSTPECSQGSVYNFLGGGVYFQPLEGRARTNSLASTSSPSAI